MEENKKNVVYRSIMLILITAIVTFMVTSAGMHRYYTDTKEGQHKVVENMTVSEDGKNINTKFQIIRQYLEQFYIGDLDIKDMTENAIKGYVEGVNDKYTEYLTKDEYEELMVNVKGDFVGIGIYMSKDTEGNIIILSPIEGSPAEEAGLEPGDLIISIDGESCADMDTNVASSKIKGKEGTTVELEILRGTEKIKKTIKRRKVEIKDSKAEVLQDNIGYIQLTTFDEGCSKNIENYIKDFQKKGIKSVIIDLRDNTGGLVTEAIKFSELFIKDGNTIMKSYNKDKEEEMYTSSNSKPMEIKLVVLVNEYSASATEIVTGALKDNKVATIVGKKTYGKGVMQDIIPLFDGALKVTIEEFKTPNGDKINGVGIAPDIVVEDDILTEEDEQLQAAINIFNQQ